MKHFYLHIHFFSLKGYNKLFYHMTTFFFPLDRKYYCDKPGHTHTHMEGWIPWLYVRARGTPVDPACHWTWG